MPVANDFGGQLGPTISWDVPFAFVGRIGLPAARLGVRAVVHFLLWSPIVMCSWPSTNRNARFGGLLAGVVGSLLLCGWDAQAFSLKQTEAGLPIHWDVPTVRFTAKLSGDAAPDQALEAALVRAVGAWQGVSGLGLEADTLGGNVVRWSGPEWAHDPDYLAVTITRYEVQTGRIASTEIVVNEVQTAWADRELETARDGHFDLQNVLTHELGHALGLGHSEVTEATMYGSARPSEVSKRVLSFDDIQGVRALYGEIEGGEFTQVPAPFAASDIEEAAVGCSSTKGSGSIPFLILFGAIVLASRRRVVLGASLSVAVLSTTVSVQASPLATTGAAGALDRAELVFEGRIIAQRAEPRPGELVVTISTIQVDACLRGVCPPTLQIEQLGGEHGNLGVSVSGVRVLPRRGAVILAARSAKSSWRLAGEDRGQLYVQAEKSPPRNESAARDLARIRIQTLLSKSPELATPPVPDTASSTIGKGLLRQ